MALKEKREGDVVVLYPKDYLMGGAETDELDKRISELVESGNKTLVINLQDTRHLNSTAIGVLIKAHSNYSKRAGAVRLCRVDKNIKNIFVITKLAMVFEVFETEEQAIAGG